MKITGAQTEPFSANRRRALVHGGSQSTAAAAPVDSAGFLGLAPADLTPAVQRAVQALWDPLESTCRHASLSIL